MSFMNDLDLQLTEAGMSRRLHACKLCGHRDGPQVFDEYVDGRVCEDFRSCYYRVGDLSELERQRRMASWRRGALSPFHSTVSEIRS